MFSPQLLNSDCHFSGLSPGQSEPMALGSPVGAQGPPQPQYLPGYLMGDTPTLQHASSKRLTGLSSSPPKSTLHTNVSSGLHKQTIFNKSDMSYTSQSDASTRLGKEKVNAPPTEGLLDSSGYQLSLHNLTNISPERRKLDYNVQSARRGAARHSLGPGSVPIGVTGHTPKKMPGGFTTPVRQVRFGQSTPYSTGGEAFAPDRGPTPTIQTSSHQHRTPPSPAQIDPFYTQGESLTADDELDETWVTVFGFPPAASSYILQQFSQYGNVLEHKVTSKGNWVHIHYQSKLQAKKALSKSGRIFGDQIMVGVTPCIVKSVMSTTTNQTDISSMSNHSAANQSAALDQSRATSIRPLTAAYRAASSEHEVLPGTSTPHQNNNILSKAMEYIFGW